MQLISEFGSIKMSINEEADIQRFGVLQKVKLAWL